MFRRLRWVLPFLLIIKSGPSFAYAPLVALAAAQQMKSSMEKVDEAAGVGFSLSELFDEVGMESDLSQKIDQSVSKLEGLYQEAKTYNSLHQELKMTLEDDLKSSKSLAKRIKAFKNAIQISKKIALIMGYRPKAAEGAAKIQEIKINSMMLEELQSMQRAQYLAQLEEKEAKIKREIFISEIRNKSKPRSHGGI